jgi:hypothetical protein
MWGVSQSARGQRFTAEPAIALLVGRRQQQFERHSLPLHLVIRLIDSSHTATAQPSAHHITPDLTSGEISQPGAATFIVVRIGVRQQVASFFNY